MKRPALREIVFGMTYDTVSKSSDLRGAGFDLGSLLPSPRMGPGLVRN
jgi:hypothetical protein